MFRHFLKVICNSSSPQPGLLTFHLDDIQFLFFYLKGRFAKREGTLSSAGSPFKWLQGLGLSWSNSRNQDFPHLLHGYRAQSLGPSSAAFPGPLARGWIWSRATRTWTSAHTGCWCCRQKLRVCCQGADPWIVHLHSLYKHSVQETYIWIAVP